MLDIIKLRIGTKVRVIGASPKRDDWSANQERFLGQSGFICEKSTNLIFIKFDDNLREAFYLDEVELVKSVQSNSDKPFKNDIFEFSGMDHKIIDIVFKNKKRYAIFTINHPIPIEDIKDGIKRIFYVARSRSIVNNVNDKETKFYDHYLHGDLVYDFSDLEAARSFIKEKL